MINPQAAWNNFISNAKYYFDEELIFYSPKRQAEYRVTEVEINRIVIKRLSVESQTTEVITKENHANYIRVVNENKGTVSKEVFANPVAIRVAIVELTQMLDWDLNIENIIEDINYSDRSSNPIIEEATNDNLQERIARYIRIRRGQNKLRENLFIVYCDTCCITGCKVKDVLHACHIFEFTKSGNNHSTNALLLRSDIHDLFDASLIGINPTTLQVEISIQLIGIEYQSLKGIRIAERIDKYLPNSQSLKYRWEIFKSINNN